ncbi:MAG: hypothetical protein Q7U47_15915, partial [Paludibacter sp.]|nr:hypothetical protein [Paludibacter sp.]
MGRIETHALMPFAVEKNKRLTSHSGLLASFIAIYLFPPCLSAFPSRSLMRFSRSARLALC